MKWPSSNNDRRHAKRYKCPLQVSCLGFNGVAADWSTVGLKVKQFDGPFPFPGETLDLKISFQIKSICVSFDCVGEVVRVEPEDRMFAIHFYDLGPPEQTMLTELAKYG